MKTTGLSFFDVGEFSDVAERAGIREGDSDPFEIMTLAMHAYESKHISQMELLDIVYVAGLLTVTNTVREINENEPIGILDLTLG